MKKIKVALGLSGGVDSAVSAYLLKKQGFDVSCIYLNCYDGPPAGGPGCRGDQDRKDALAVAMHLGLPFQVLDFRKEYQAAVIDYFKKEYLLGRTPNPDVICNRDIKFGLFLDWAVKAGFDYVATGHYAKLRSAAFSRKSRNKTKIAKNNSRRSRSFASFANTKAYTYDQLQENNNSVFLVQPRDVHKDQTYFLWAVPREKFKRVLFPLGNLLKTEVREIALKIGLPVAKKKDSTGICFVGEVRVEDFLKKLGVKEKRGEVVIRSVIGSPLSVIGSRLIGNQSVGSEPINRKLANQNLKTDNRKPITEDIVIGSHRGVWFYTIGQRHGFDIAGPWTVDHGPWTIDKKPSSIVHRLSSIVHSPDRPPLYVIEKDIKKNRLVVGFGADCYRDRFEVGDLNWLAPEVASLLPWSTSTRPPAWTSSMRSRAGRKSAASGLRRPPFGGLLVRIRHGGELISCSLEMDHRQWIMDHGSLTIDHGQKTVYRLSSIVHRPLSITVRLRSPQRGIAAGQSAVFYLPRRIRRLAEKAGAEDGVVLGGGIIN